MFSTARRCTLTVFLLSVVLVAPERGSAQQPTMGSAMQDCPMMMYDTLGMPMAGVTGMMPDLVAMRRALHLSDVQVDRIQKLRDAHLDLARRLRRDIEDASVKLVPLFAAPKPHLDAIRHLLERRALLVTQLQLSALDLRAKTYDLLTPAQREKLPAEGWRTHVMDHGMERGDSGR